MRRRLLKVAAVMSLVLCVATLGLWVRSARVSELIRLHRMGQTADGYWAHHADIISTRGSVIVFIYLERLIQSDPPSRALAYEEHRRARPERVRWLGLPVGTRVPALGGLEHLAAGRQHFGYGSFGGAYPGHHERGIGLLFPHWAAFLLLAVLPCAILAIRYRNRARRVSGCCPTCGYDLRATPNRCPECGSPPHNPPMQRTATAGSGAVK